MTVQEFLQLNEKSIGASGAAWDDCSSVPILNKARSALYGIDAWTGLVDTICVNTCSNINLPWFADIVKGAYRSNRIINISTGEYWVKADGSDCGCEEHITDMNRTSPVPVDNNFSSRIGIKLHDFEDEGIEVKVTYQNESGSYITEVLHGAIAGFSVTETKVKKIVSISKPATYGYVAFHGSNSDGAPGPALFFANPLETHLQYKQYCLSAACCSSCSQVILKVKRKYVPLGNLHYNLPIEFPEHALALAMQAISELDKRSSEGIKAYQVLISSAINYMRKNEIKEKDTYGNAGHTDDYPSIVI